jgi:exodeoxyribonuclease VII large subunit
MKEYDSSPSAAAELAVSLQSDTENRLITDRDRLLLAMDDRISKLKRESELFYNRLEAKSPSRMIEQFRERIRRFDELAFSRMKNKIDRNRARLLQEERLHSLMNLRLEREKARLSKVAGRLDADSPLKKLRSGYGYPEKMDGTHVMKASDLSIGEEFRMTMEDGVVKAQVNDIIDGDVRG